MNRLMDDKDYYIKCMNNSGKRYEEIYDVKSIMNKFVHLYREVVSQKYIK